MAIVEVEVKDLTSAQLIAGALVTGRDPKGFAVTPPGGLEVFNEDHGWIFTVDEEQAAVIRFLDEDAIVLEKK